MFVVVHSRAWERSWKRLGNQTGFGCVFRTNRMAGFEENLQMVTHTLPWKWLPPHLKLVTTTQSKDKLGNGDRTQVQIWKLSSRAALDMVTLHRIITC